MGENHPETGRLGHELSDATTPGGTGSEETGPEETVLLRRAERGELKTAHLVLGLVYLGIAAAWALHASGVVENGAGYLVPGVLVVAGLVGLIAGFVASRRRTHTREETLR